MIPLRPGFISSDHLMGDFARAGRNRNAQSRIVRGDLTSRSVGA